MVSVTDYEEHKQIQQKRRKMIEKKIHVGKGSFMLVRTVTAKYRKHKGGEKRKQTACTVKRSVS